MAWGSLELNLLITEQWYYNLHRFDIDGKVDVIVFGILHDFHCCKIDLSVLSL